MKSFAQYLIESKQTYNYRIKMAGDVAPELMDELKKQLQEFDVVSFSEPKTTPVQKQLADFPNVNNERMTFVDVTFNYPAFPPQILQIWELLGQDPNKLLMQDLVYAERMDDEREAQDKESKNLLTDTDFPANNKEQEALKDDYGTDPYDHAVLKNAYRSDFTVAGGKTPKATTSNDFPMGTKSPVGTHQNALPKPKSFAR